jgi:CRP-like cAMP-binding protein
MMSPIFEPTQNAILRVLPEDERSAIVAACKRVRFTAGDVLESAGSGASAVYFPLSGIISTVMDLEDGNSIDTAIVGWDGMVGLLPFVDIDVIGVSLVGQMDGDALAIDGHQFRSDLDRWPMLSYLVLRYASHIIAMLSVTIACVRFHEIRERYVRWLLSFQDLARDNSFPLTQEALANVLGVRRASITQVARVLQDQGLIDYHRGRMTILNRDGLEALACECYRHIRRSYDRALGDGLRRPEGPIPG